MTFSFSGGRPGRGVVRGFAQKPAVKLAAAVVGVIGVIDWFILVAFAYAAMHLH